MLTRFFLLGLLPVASAFSSLRARLFATVSPTTALPWEGADSSTSSSPIRNTTQSSRSLAGPYRIDCVQNDDSWVLTPIQAWTVNPQSPQRDDLSSEGRRAWTVLQDESTPKVSDDHPLRSTIRLQVSWKNNHECAVSVIPARTTCWTEQDASLVDTLSRILVQRSLRASDAGSLTLQFPGQDKSKTIVWDPNGDHGMAQLFHEEDKEASELVELVNQHGAPLGQVPRKLAHQHNLLHRGIGVLVTESLGLNSTPNLYLHQRTPTKRIFPSLYDMFVGGVSLADEAALTTAQREVAEELNLHCTDHWNPECILQCIVCTSYNRCVVDLFEYVMDTNTETIQWQEEEVAWGSFVPYHVVAAAADLSIQRLAANGEWPGQSPPCQSKRKGILPQNQVTAPNQVHGYNEPWDAWDFVPDGLLVWEAWLQHQGECFRDTITPQ